MKHTEVIERLCKLQGEVAQHIGFEHASDCFCGKSGFWNAMGYDPETDYRNDGVALEFIERATKDRIVLEAAGIADAKQLLVGAICGRPFGSYEAAETAVKNGLAEFTGDQWNPRWTWLKTELEKLPIGRLCEIYKSL